MAKSIVSEWPSASSRNRPRWHTLPHALEAFVVPDRHGRSADDETFGL
ncbi:MAG: hypothetical protein R2789_00015 [Microthrixaceae bacterium]